MTRLFISYRRSKASRVDALVAALEAEGVDVWIDRNEIEDAASIQRRIDGGLAGCHALLAWYCVDYPASRACQWELTAALIAAGAETAPVKRILVINPEADNVHIQPLQVRDLQHFSAQDDDVALARRIAKAIKPIQGELGVVRRLSRPASYGFTPIGSTRFVGRVTKLWEIHSALAAGNFAIVAGLPSSGAAGELARLTGSGGIGKSLLVEEYALRFGAFWLGGLFWLRAYGNSDNPDESPKALAQRRELAYGSQLVGFCLQIGIDTREKSNAQLRAELGRCLTTPYLWIVDDLPDGGRDELDPWLAPSSNGRTLITTRSRRLDGLGTALELGLLEPLDARVLLTDGNPAQPDDEAAIERILELLGGHALALDVARAACRRLGFKRFCKRLEKPDDDAMALAGQIAQDTPSGHTPYIAATLLGSVKQLDPQALDCVRIASLLAAAAIPFELVSACLATADALNETDAENVAARGVQQLLNHSLAEEADAAGAFTVHTLIARTLRYCDAAGASRCEELKAAATQALIVRMGQATDIRNHLRLRPILPHAQWLAERRHDAEGLDLAGWIGRLEFEAGRYRDAERWCRVEYIGSLILLGKEHPDTLTSMNNLADTLGQQGDNAGARALHEQALAISRRVLGEEHPATLTSMNNLAGTLGRQGDNAGARAVQEQTLSIRRRVLGDEHPATLTSMNNLASTLGQQGDNAGARALEEQTLAIIRRVLGEEHPNTLTSMSNLASTLGRQGDNVGARALQEQALAICRRVLGEEHPATLTSMNNLASTLWQQGDHAGARALEEQTLANFRRVLGEEHPDTLTIMNNLAGTLWQQGDNAGARALAEQVLSIQRRMLGEEHPNTLTSMNNFASTLWQQGDNAGARALYEQVLSIRRRVLGEEHPDTLISMSNLASTLGSQGDNAGARALQEQVLSIRRRVLGDEHPDTTVSAWNLLRSRAEAGDQAAGRTLIETDLAWLISRDRDSLSGDQQEIQRMLMDYLAIDADEKHLPQLAHSESTTLEVDPRKCHVPTGINVQPGERYTFTAAGKWKDWFVTCDHRGWGSGWPLRFNRVKGQPFFRLCGSIGKDDRAAFAINTTQPWTVPDTPPPDGDDQLYLFANDHPWMYWNNRTLTEDKGGPMRVTITRLE